MGDEEMKADNDPLGISKSLNIMGDTISKINSHMNMIKAHKMLIDEAELALDPSNNCGIKLSTDRGGNFFLNGKNPSDRLPLEAIKEWAIKKMGQEYELIQQLKEKL